MKVGILFGLSVLLFSCDVPGWVLVKNTSNSPMQFRYVSTGEPQVREFDILVPPKQDTGEYLGFGYWWTKGTIEGYAQALDTFEIKTGTKGYIITDSLALSRYLRKHRSKGVFKAGLFIRTPTERERRDLFDK